MKWDGQKNHTETYFGYIDIVRSFLEVQIVNGNDFKTKKWKKNDYERLLILLIFWMKEELS